MAVEFVVEDGTGKTDATTYLSVEDMKQLWSNAGYNYSALSSTDIKIILNNASQSLDGRYGAKWPGERASLSQALDWPRSSVADKDGYDRPSTTLPVEIERATAEMAYAVHSGVDVDPNDVDGGDLKSEYVKVEGAVTESKEYFGGSARTYPTIPKVEGALRRLLGPSGKYGAMTVRRV